MEARRPAHPHVRIDHRIDALTALYLRFHEPDVASSGDRREIAFLPDASRILNDQLGHARPRLASGLSSSDGVLLPSSERGGCAFPIAFNLGNRAGGVEVCERRQNYNLLKADTRHRRVETWLMGCVYSHRVPCPPIPGVTARPLTYNFYPRPLAPPLIVTARPRQSRRHASGHRLRPHTVQATGRHRHRRAQLRRRRPPCRRA